MNDIETTVTEIYHPRPNGLAEVSWQAFKSLQLALDFVEKQRLGVKHMILRGPRRYLDDKEIAQITALGLARA